MTFTGTYTSAASPCRGVAANSKLHLQGRRRSFGLNPTCALSPDGMRNSRRLISLSLVLSPFLSENAASAANIMDKYLKKKKLDPLESYVPAVLLTEKQIAELGENLETASPKFADCRSLLRSGPAASLRVNIRAVAQYASDSGKGQSAFGEVDQCLRALEELDSMLLRASRNDPQATIEPMKARIDAALSALNRLLKTVPDDLLDKGKAMAEAYLIPGDDVAPENGNLQLAKQLESLL